MHFSLQSLSPLLFLLYLDLRYRENDLIILPDLSCLIIPDPSLPPSLPPFLPSSLPSFVCSFTHSLGILFPPPIPVLPHTVLMYIFKVYSWTVSLLPTCVFSYTSVCCVLLPALLLQCCVGSRSYSSEYLQWLLSAACSTVCSTGQRCPPTLHHHYRTTVDIFVQVPLSENLLGVYPPGELLVSQRVCVCVCTWFEGRLSPL